VTVSSSELFNKLPVLRRLKIRQLQSKLMAQIQEDYTAGSTLVIVTPPPEEL
jgi:hypothetical protein